jgi:hypothetical protein
MISENAAKMSRTVGSKELVAFKPDINLAALMNTGTVTNRSGAAQAMPRAKSGLFACFVAALQSHA